MDFQYLLWNNWIKIHKQKLLKKNLAKLHCYSKCTSGVLSYGCNVNKKAGKHSPYCWEINITNRRIPVLVMSLSLCLTPTYSRSVSPQSSTVLLSDCLFSFHEAPVKLGDPVSMPAIRGIYSGSLTNHEEIDCESQKTESSAHTPVV